MRFYATNFSDIGKQMSARLDPKYRYFWDVEKGILFRSLSNTKLGNVISEISVSKVKKGELDEPRQLMSIPGQAVRSARIQNLDEVTEIDSDKNPLGGADIIISKLGLPKGLIFYNGEKCEILIGSTEFIPYKLIDDQWNSKFLTYLLLLPEVLEKLARLESGKTPSHRRVNPFDLMNVKIPVVAKTVQDIALGKIEPIESEIQRLQGTINDPAETISRVFAREFGFDLTRFDELKRQKIFFVDLRDFANNDDLRFSVKFHRQAAKFVESELRSRTDKSIKDFLAEDIVLGASVSPDDYDDDGEFYYVAMSSIKSWSFDKESARSVSAEYVNRNRAKSVKKADIIMARSGEGTIGKVALIEGDEQGIFADFTMRIRLRGYDAEFAYYYFRTQYMQYLIETHKKGLGNNTNIFPNQIKEFPMLEVSRETQTRLVREIRAEFSTQDKIKRRVEIKRAEIDEIFQQLIRSTYPLE
jgi:restriction endonuclease S subunit